MAGSSESIDSVDRRSKCIQDFFGTLCTDAVALKTKVGWDNVTGVGVPNGQAFADAFHQ